VRWENDKDDSEIMKMALARMVWMSAVFASAIIVQAEPAKVEDPSGILKKPIRCWPIMFPSPQPLPGPLAGRP
jgi:hypothetical protein